MALAGMPAWAGEQANAQQTAAAEPAAKSTPQAKDAKDQQGVKAKPKVDLLNLAPANTDEAARRAAEKLAAKEAEQRGAAKQPDKKSGEQSTKAEPDTAASGDAGGVTEFHVASPNTATTAPESKDGAVNRAPGRSAKIHGSVYGSTDPKHPGTRADGAEVGVTSKSGKTSVYAGTDQTRATPPQ
jgi:hypothetical protein